jgi:Cytochrome P460
MKPTRILAVAGLTVAGVTAYTITVSGGTAGSSAPVYVTRIPPGYRDWRLISVAHEEGNLHSFAVVLGNDVAIDAFRAGKLPYPDGTAIVALHYSHSPSAENDKVFGDPQSFVPGRPTNIQLEVKDSKKYAATGGWGFGHFNTNGTLGSKALLSTCAPCHAKASRDFVFTHYAP